MQQPTRRAAPLLTLIACLVSAALAAAPGEDRTGSASQPPSVGVSQTQTSSGAAASPPQEEAPPNGTPDLGLEGVSWRLVAYRLGDALKEALEPMVGAARFRFEAGRVAGSAGCNRIGGGYTLDGDKLSFQANMLSTMMACPEPLMAQDQAVGAALVKVAGWRVAGEMLELVDSAGAPLLRFLWLKPAPLVGQVWQLTGYNNGKGAIASSLSGTEINLEFRDDGTLGGSDGCNRYMSGYTLEAGVLTIGPLATTRMACRGPDGVAEQASAYAAALGRVTGYRIDGGELTLLDREGKTAARFRADQAQPAAPEAGPAPGVGGGAPGEDSPAPAAR